MIFHLFESSSSTSPLNSHHRDRVGAYLTYTTQVSQHHLHLHLDHLSSFNINNIESTQSHPAVLTSVTVIGRHLDDCVHDRRRRMSSKSKSKSFPEVFVVAVFLRLRLRRFDFFPFLEVFVKVRVLSSANPKADVSEP